MKKTYTSYTNKFKVRVVMAALKNDKTLNELATDFKIPKKNIQNWKNEFIENAETVFNKNKSNNVYKLKLKKFEKEKDNLHRKIGELTVLNEWAKKKIEEYGL